MPNEVLAMAKRYLRGVRVFLASPSDVSSERRAVEAVVAELNRSVARQLDLVLELIRWEEMVPAAGEPQEVIFEQARFPELDLFIGILRNRFGTPTAKASSGTEAEFRQALNLFVARGSPRIMMYFGAQSPRANNTKDEQQRALVAGFRSEVQRVALLKDYGLPEEFEGAIRQDLILALFEIARKEGAKSAQSSVPVMQGAEALPPVRMIRIPEGRFRLSGSRGEGHISTPFWIDEFPVTNREYLEFLNATGFMSHSEPSLLRRLDRFRAKMELVVGSSRQPNYPVTEITWTEAVAYSAWKGKRLPTALEWERAAAGVSGRLYPWGDSFDAAKCNCLESGIGATSPVDAYPEGRSECGCYDMAGNVFEWTDTWGNVPRFSHALGSEKINKGGSYNRSAQHLLNSYAESDPLDLRMMDVGFRCAWDPDSSHVFRT